VPDRVASKWAAKIEKSGEKTREKMGLKQESNFFIKRLKVEPMGRWRNGAR